MRLFREVIQRHQDPAQNSHSFLEGSGSGWVQGYSTSRLVGGRLLSWLMRWLILGKLMDQTYTCFIHSVLDCPMLVNPVHLRSHFMMTTFSDRLSSSLLLPSLQTLVPASWMTKTETASSRATLSLNIFSGIRGFLGREGSSQPKRCQIWGGRGMSWHVVQTQELLKGLAVTWILAGCGGVVRDHRLERSRLV